MDDSFWMESVLFVLRFGFKIVEQNGESRRVSNCFRTLGECDVLVLVAGGRSFSDRHRRRVRVRKDTMLRRQHRRRRRRASVRLLKKVIRKTAQDQCRCVDIIGFCHLTGQSKFPKVNLIHFLMKIWNFSFFFSFFSPSFKGFVFKCLLAESTNNIGMKNLHGAPPQVFGGLWQITGAWQVRLRFAGAKKLVESGIECRARDGAERIETAARGRDGFNDQGSKSIADVAHYVALSSSSFAWQRSATAKSIESRNADKSWIDSRRAARRHSQRKSKQQLNQFPHLFPRSITYKRNKHTV